jgi:hypothetical protein
MAWTFQTEYKNSDTGTYYSPEMKEIPEEQARFDALGKTLAQDIETKWMAGDRNRNSPDYPFFPITGYPRPLEGYRWPMPDEPFRAQLVKQEEHIIDIIGSTFGCYALSQKVIDMIEAIEPGVHQFLPYELLNPDGSAHPAKRWLLNVCTRVEVIDRERSNVQWMAAPSDRWFYDAPGKAYLVARADEASKRALWHEWRYHGLEKTFVTDRLWDALKAAGIRGWQPSYSYHHHIEEV